MNKKDFAERLKNHGRNDECPCGSGKKYKKCHLAEDQEAEFKALKKLENKAAEEAAAAAEEAKEKGDDEANAQPAKDIRKGKQIANQAIPAQRRKDNKPNIPRRSAV